MNEPRWIPLAELHEDAENVRLHNDRNRKVVRGSLEKWGQIETLVVQASTGRVLSGNCRLDEMRTRGDEGAWCFEVEAEGDEATEVALTMNRSAELASWDAEQLAAVLGNMEVSEDLWTMDEIEAMCEPAGDASNSAARGGGGATLDPIRAILIEDIPTDREQRALLEELTSRGFKVRAQNL